MQSIVITKDRFLLSFSVVSVCIQSRYVTDMTVITYEKSVYKKRTKTSGKQVKQINTNNFANNLDFFFNTLWKGQRTEIEQEFDDTLWRLDEDGNYPEAI